MLNMLSRCTNTLILWLTCFFYTLVVAKPTLPSNLSIYFKIQWYTFTICFWLNEDQWIWIDACVNIYRKRSFFDSKRWTSRCANLPRSIVLYVGKPPGSNTISGVSWRIISASSIAKYASLIHAQESY